MILCQISDAERYKNISPAVACAIEWLGEHFKDEFVKGSVELGDTGIRVNSEEVALRPRENAVLEAHRRYIDIHVPVSCDEIIGWRPVYGLESVIEPYTRQPDRAFYSDAPLHYFTIHPGEFAIMAPHDAHAPIIGSGTIDKICMKVRVVL